MKQPGQSIAIFNFENAAIKTWKEGDRIYFSPRAVCERLGLSWQGQHKKLTSDEEYEGYSCVTQRVTHEANRNVNRDIFGLDTEVGYYWLASISLKRVKPEVKPVLLKFKRECIKALCAYWEDGIVVKPEPPPEELSGPQKFLIIAQNMVDMEEKQKEIENRLEKVEVHTAHLEGPELYAVSGWKKKRGHINVNEQKIGFLAARKAKQLGLTLGTWPHPKYGTVNTYPIELLDEVYEGLTEEG